jgi:hypothetical protein
MTQKLQRHKDTRTLPNSTTHHLCRAQEAQTHTTSGAAHAIDQKSRRSANEENVHQTEMLEDPLIIVRGKELVAPDPTACDHHPAAWSGPAPADRNRTHPGVVDVRGRSDFSRFDPRPERPHFSNFGPPAEGACGRHQFSSLLSSLSAHLGQSHGFPTGQQWAAALKSTQPTPHCGLLSSSPRGSTTALPAAAAELRHGGEGPPRPWGRAEVLPRSPILELMLRPERMRAAHSAVARHMASGAGLAAA